MLFTAPNSAKRENKSSKKLVTNGGHYVQLVKNSKKYVKLGKTVEKLSKNCKS